MSEKPARLFMIPSPRLGTSRDVTPERITAGMNDWITLSKEVLQKKRKAAEGGTWRPTSEISEDHNDLHPFGAQYCPALQEVNSIGYLLKWPASAVFKNVGPRAWEIHASETNAFYKFHGMSSFPEAGQSDVISIGLGWLVITPPGWSVLIKNLPNNLTDRQHGIVFAEGVVRSDQATIPLQVHAFIPPGSPKEIHVTRGEPMALLMPFKRERLELAVMDDPESVAEGLKAAALDQETFAAAAGRYRALYIDDENLSTLYPVLLDRLERREAGGGGGTS